MAEEHVTGELQNLRKEVFEVRNLVIKTDNLLKTFHLELKDIDRRQQSSETRHKLGHATAYASLAVVAIVGALMYGSAVKSGARVESEAMLAQAEKTQAAADAALAQAKQRATAMEQANVEALAVWQLVTSPETSKQDEGLLRAAKLDAAKLTPFARTALDFTTAGMRQGRAESAFATGMAEQRASRPRTAKDAFEAFLTLAEQMPPAWKKTERLQAAYQLGALYNQLGEHDKAVPVLKKYVAEGESSSAKAYAYLLMGDSLEATRRQSEAKDAYRAGLKLDPEGVTGGLLKRRLGVPPPPAEGSG